MRAAPMMSLARQTVRSSWRGYLGAFVALSCGVVLLMVTVTLIGSVETTGRRPGVSDGQRAQLEDLAAMFGMMAAIAVFMAVFVVSSTFGFVVASRQRELGLLRLVGATPRQVRRLLLGESAVVAAAATAVGGLLGTLLAPTTFWLLRAIGITDLELRAPSPWIAWSVAVPAGAGVALLGAWRSSRRASRVAPSAALREATLQRTRPTLVQLLVALLCLGGLTAAFVVAPRLPPLFALLAAVLLPQVVVVGLMAVGPALMPRLAGLLAAPFVSRDVAARIARDELRAAGRTTSAIAAPVLAISAIAGSLLLTLSFTADWTSAQSRAQLRAALVVEGADPDTVAAIAGDPTVAVADVRRRAVLRFDDDGRPGHREETDVVDLATAGPARGLHATSGSLDDFHGHAIAVTRTWVTDSGTGLGGSVPVWIGGKRIPLQVVAVVPDAPDLYGELVVPADLLGDERIGAETGTVFVVPQAGVGADQARDSLERLLDQSTGRVALAAAWIDATTAQARRANDLALSILLGPAGLYAAIAIVNATLIGASQRRRQRELVQLLGATRDQVRRAALWQAALVCGTGLLLGGTTTGLLGWLVRRATTADLAGTGVDVGATVPWLPLLGIGLTCALLAVVAAVSGSRTVRPLH